MQTDGNRGHRSQLQLFAERLDQLIQRGLACPVAVPPALLVVANTAHFSTNAGDDAEATRKDTFGEVLHFALLNLLRLRPARDKGNKVLEAEQVRKGVDGKGLFQVLERDLRKVLFSVQNTVNVPQRLQAGIAEARSDLLGSSVV